MSEEVTPKSEALAALEECGEFLLLMPGQFGAVEDNEIEWSYFWVTDETEKWAPALVEFLKVAAPDEPVVSDQ